jgi:hypothetical protein
LCFSHSSHLWNDVNDGGWRAAAARRGDDENDDEAAEDLLFSAFSKTQKDLLCCHEQG